MPVTLGKLNHKRTPAERELDLVEEAKWYLRGDPQHVIAAKVSAMRDYNIGRTMVYKDLITIRQRWLDSYMNDFNEYKVKELARIDELEHAYWEEWERSRLDQDTIQTEKVSDSNLDASGKPTSQWVREKVKAIKKKREGSAAYLEGVRWCIEKRCNILGLNAPKEVTVNWRDEAARYGVNPDELEDNLVDQFLAAAKRTGERSETETTD